MSIFRKRAARRDATRRHRQLMDAARRTVNRYAAEGRVTRINPAEFVALVFGRHAFWITEREALDYINAVLVDRGFPLCETPTEPEVDDQ